MKATRQTMSQPSPKATNLLGRTDPLLAAIAGVVDEETETNHKERGIYSA
jgi:hypothetical protein